MHNDR